MVRIIVVTEAPIITCSRLKVSYPTIPKSTNDTGQELPYGGLRSQGVFRV